MKNLAVLISGAPEGRNLRDLEIEPGTMAGDVLRALNLEGYLLSREGSAQAFAAEEAIYDSVMSGDKLRATPIAEVGGGFWDAVRRLFVVPEVRARERLSVTERVVRAPVATPPALVRPRSGTRSTALRVERDRRPLSQVRGWRREGKRLFGAYRTPRGSFVGSIDLAHSGRPEFYINNPPQSVLTGDHAACFRKRERGWYFVHMAVASAEVDSGIVAIERLIAEAIGSGMRENKK